MKTILILATLDTKYQEAIILKEYVEKYGCRGLILDCSLRRQGSGVESTVREEMMERAEVSEEHLSALSKNDALILMTELAGKQLLHLYEQQQIDGAIGIGGVQGTLISTGAMQELPVGVPKVVLSAVANGNATFGPLVGMSDMTIMHSVVDVAGSNAVLKGLMSNAAAAVCGMAKHRPDAAGSTKAIGLTMGGVTTKCGNYIKEILEDYGYEVVIFHCNGIGSMAMEKLAEQGQISAIIDLTPHDVTDYLFGGMMPADVNRYEVLKKYDIPTIIIPGCADIILFNGMENVPEQLKGRKLVAHNSIHTHVKANYQEMYKLGRFIAEKANDFRGEARILIPEEGFSQKNCPGEVLYEPESDRGFKEAVETYGNDRLIVETVPLHINDREFAQLCADELMEMVGDETGIDHRLNWISGQLAAICQSAYESGLQRANGGNVSARVDETHMLVKSKGSGFNHISDKDFVLTDFAGTKQKGEGEPTKESLMHGTIYRCRAEVNAVVHVHAPYAAAWSAVHEQLPLSTWQAQLKFGREIPVLNVESPMMRQEDLPGLEAILAEKQPPRGFILRNHGISAMGKTLEEALQTAELIEETAKIAVLKAMLK